MKSADRLSPGDRREDPSRQGRATWLTSFQGRASSSLARAAETSLHPARNRGVRVHAAGIRIGKTFGHGVSSRARGLPCPLRRTGLYHPAVAAVFGAQNASPFTDRGADVRVYER